MLGKLTTIFVILCIFFTSELSSNEKYKIGFSQCTTGDVWRQTMQREMMIELAFFPDLELIIKDANNDNEQQIKDIQQLFNEGIDLLIVSPNESDPITPIVEQVYNSGIPVIIIDRKINSEAYTAYIGANNYLIGKEAGIYAAKLLNGAGKVIEITGLVGSSPASERHNGFIDVISEYPDIEIVASVSGKWNYSDSKIVLNNFLKLNKDFDLVYAHNDRMARAAYEVISAQGKDEKFILGTDGLLGEDGGIQDVIDGKIDATFLYQTGGDEAIQLAHKILYNLPFERNNILETLVIDINNAKVLKLQYEVSDNLQSKIEAQKTLLANKQEKYNNQRILLRSVLILLGVVVILVAFIFRAFRNKQRANQKLKQQKEEIEKQRDQIIEVSEKLEEVTQTKLRFFTNISHEFRTPLTLIVGPLEDMIHSSEIPVHLNSQLSMMHRNSLRLLRLINQLMDFRKIENAKMRLSAGEYDVVTFIREIKQSFENLASQKQIQLNFKTSEPSIKLWFDWDKLDKVIFNLLSNAFKFTPEKGTIAIHIKTEEPRVETLWKKEVVIEVYDNGKGISETHLSHIFDRFYQVEKTQSFMGTGLGLSLSKEFTELHQGKIDAQSTVGEGTTFTIHLPLGEEHLSDVEKIEIPVNQPQKHEKPISDEIHYNPTITEEGGKIEFDISEKQTVLLVEDEKDVRTYIKESLQDYYRILEAENGKEALKVIQKDEPDLIVSDIMMSEMDGLELTRVIKSDLKTCHIPIILLTAKASQEQKFEGLEEGADSYIPKPFNRKHLQIRVKKLLELRKKMHERYKGQLVIAEEDLELSHLDKNFLHKISKIVKEHDDKEELSVEELSQMVGLSRIHVYRKIKKLTGMSVSEFIGSVKLKLSLNLIKTSGKSISEIAYEVGFSSPTYFSKCFKDHFGVLPSEYKKKQTN